MRRGGVAVDAVVAVVAFAISAAILASWSSSDPEVRDPTAMAYVVAALYSVTVVARSRRPLAAVTAALALGLVYSAAKWPPALVPVVLLTVYTAATRLAWPASRRLLVVAVVVTALGTSVAPGPTNLLEPTLAASAWLVGHYVRTRSFLAVEQARQAVVEERLRIARELHDVVAHTMSVVAVHAGTGRLVVRSDPDAGARALETIETSTRSALAEMRRLLGVLRADDAVADLEPSAGLGDVEALARDVSASGVPVEVRVEGERPADVPPGVDLSAYRIVQEALTNVLRHAGAGARASVVVSWSPTEVEVAVTDDGRGGDPASSGHGVGHGVVGMRERVAMHGGEFVAGERPEGGFEVRATLPFGAR